MKKDYPEWTVPEEICRVGEFRADCPYTVESDKETWKEHEADQRRLKELGVDIDDYGINRVLK